MSLKRTGSKANGNDDVQRTANARIGLFFVLKSFHRFPYVFEQEKRNTVRCLRSYTVESKSLIGGGHEKIELVHVPLFVGKRCRPFHFLESLKKFQDTSAGC